MHIPLFFADTDSRHLPETEEITMDFANSETCRILMRSFAGECQAHTRYLLAAKTAAAQQIPLLEQVFRMTAKQELIHAQKITQQLQKNGISQIEPGEGYPLDPPDNLLQILDAAVQHELHEADELYPAFAETAAAEGKAEAAALLRGLADIERSHAARFRLFADFMREGSLFRAQEQTVWLCLNCGHLHTGTEPPQQCSVCGAVQGYAVRAALAPFTQSADDV